MVEDTMTTCIYKDAAIIVRAIFEGDVTTFFFENPTTGKWCEDINEIYKGWESLDADKIAEWKTLESLILSDKTLRDKMLEEVELIDYNNFN